VRQLLASTDLTGYLDWPGLAQVVRLQHTWEERGQPEEAVHYAVTSLAPPAGPPKRLLALKRGHWRIENRLHRVKDVTLGEDASLLHTGQGPSVVALLRDAAVSLLHRARVRQVTACLRHNAQHPESAVALLFAPAPPRA
jgi:hypothetical protein